MYSSPVRLHYGKSAVSTKHDRIVPIKMPYCMDNHVIIDVAVIILNYDGLMQDRSIFSVLATGESQTKIPIKHNYNSTGAYNLIPWLIYCLVRINIFYVEY